MCGARGRLDDGLSWEQIGYPCPDLSTCKADADLFTEHYAVVERDALRLQRPTSEAWTYRSESTDDPLFDDSATCAAGSRRVTPRHSVHSVSIANRRLHELAHRGLDLGILKPLVLQRAARAAA